LESFFEKNFNPKFLMPVSISVNVCRCCGCKSTLFIEFCKLFSKLFFIFFISGWYGGFYKAKFFGPLSGFGWICPFGAGFATKAPGRKVFLLALLSSKKAQSRVFLSLCWVLAKTPGRKVFLFLPVKRNLLLKITPLAPREVEILLCPPRRTQKIGTDSGK
jgi:hypothetical protein